MATIKKAQRGSNIPSIVKPSQKMKIAPSDTERLNSVPKKKAGGKISSTKKIKPSIKAMKKGGKMKNCRGGCY